MTYVGDEIGVASAAKKKREKMARYAYRPPIDAKSSRITVDCRTLERTIEVDIAAPPTPPTPDYDGINREAIERLEKENAELRKALGLRNNAPRGIPISEIQSAFVKKLQVAGFTINDEPYDIPHLKGACRAAHYSKPRHVCIWLCCRLSNASLPSIGRAFGNRDHTSIMHARNHVDDAFGWAPALRVIADEILAEYARGSASE